MAELSPPTPSGHHDHFCADSLPPRALWPDLTLGPGFELRYPGRLNAATELLDVHLSGGGGRPAVVFPGGRWSYNELAAVTNRMAHALVDDFGLEPGQRVLLRSPNNPFLAAAWLAVLKAGGVVVSTMPLLRRRELASIADQAEIQLSLCDHRLLEDCTAAMTTRLDGAPRPGSRVVVLDGDAASLTGRAAQKSDTFEAIATSAEDVAIIAFTSGTTGQGKGTMHFHRDILAACDCFPPSVLRAEPDDLFCGSPPLAFTFGLGGLLLFPLRIGASTLLIEQASPPHLAAAMAEFGATVCFTAPTAYRAMTPLTRQHDLGRLRKCVSAGETLPRPTFEAWQQATGLRIIDGIGSTELLHIFISSSGDEIRPGSTGKVVPGYEARVIDETGAEVQPGVIGRLAVRGPTGCRYLNNPERQREYVQSGWNLTGDSYIRDQDGYFWYQARTDDLIVSAGHKIAGPEVEAALLEHPSVRECGVVGVPHTERGMIAKAFIVLTPSATAGPDLVHELQDFVKRQIAPYKYPREIEFVEQLPRTESGKLQRFRLRQAEETVPRR